MESMAFLAPASRPASPFESLLDIRLWWHRHTNTCHGCVMAATLLCHWRWLEMRSGEQHHFYMIYIAIVQGPIELSEIFWEAKNTGFSHKSCDFLDPEFKCWSTPGWWFGSEKWTHRSRTTKSMMGIQTFLACLFWCFQHLYFVGSTAVFSLKYPLPPRHSQWTDSQCFLIILPFDSFF